MRRAIVAVMALGVATGAWLLSRDGGRGSDRSPLAVAEAGDSKTLTRREKGAPPSEGATVPRDPVPDASEGESAALERQRKRLTRIRARVEARRDAMAAVDPGAAGVRSLELHLHELEAKLETIPRGTPPTSDEPAMEGDER